MGTLFTGLGVAAALSVTDIIPVHQGGARAVGLTGAQLLTLVGTAYVPLAGGTMTGALTLPAITPALTFTGFAAHGIGFDSNYGMNISDSTGVVFGTRVGVLALASTKSLAWTSGALSASPDVVLARDTIATLAQRNGTTQQIFRLYNTYTDSSNFERLTLTGVAGASVNITAETLGTGGDNLDIVLTPAGTGSVYVPIGASAAPGIRFIGTDAGFWYEGGLLHCRGQNANAVNWAMSAVGMRYASDNFVGWASGSAYSTNADTALARNAAGIVEVNNGTAGTYRDLKLRNLLSTGYAQIDSGTLTASAPALSITQTWTTGAAFTGALMNITDTSSAAGSLFADFQVGGTSKLQIRKDGVMLVRPATTNVSSLNFYDTTYGIGVDVGTICMFAPSSQPVVNLRVGSLTGTIGLSLHAQNQAIYFGQAATSTGLILDAAATLAQRNGTTQQIFRLYNTYTDASNYERLTLTGVAGTSVNITAESAGTGSANLDITLTPKGTGNVYSAGGYKLASGATIKNSDATGSGVTYLDASNIQLRRGDGASTFGLLKFGGSSSSAPALKGSGTAMQVRLADDSGYGSLESLNFGQTGYHQMTEMTAPSAPATNSVRIYAEDNGAGKTRLMALFATGSAVQLGIEP